MMLQTILCGTFVPPPVAQTRKCYLANIGNGKQWVPKAKRVYPREKINQLLAIIAEHPEGISASRISELTGRGRVAIHVTLMKLTDEISYKKQPAAGKRKAHRLFYLKVKP